MANIAAEGKTEPKLNGLAGLSPNVIYLALVSFFTDISSEMTLTTLPLFLSDVLGVRTSIIGLIEGLAETTASIMKVFSLVFWMPRTKAE